MKCYENVNIYSIITKRNIVILEFKQISIVLVRGSILGIF